MKKKLILLCTLLSIAVFLLGGCNSMATATVSTSNGLSTATKLALGTLKLEGTDQALTDSQVHELLTLWQGYQSLSNSDTTSSVELDALVAQIQGVMTAEQIKTIETYNLTDQSLSEELSSLGESASANIPASTPNASGINQAAQMGGPGGIPGGGGDSVMSAIGGGAVAQSTPAATQSTLNASTAQVNPMLLQALIQILQAKSQMIG
jgi:hypothetical protein